MTHFRHNVWLAFGFCAVAFLGRAAGEVLVLTDANFYNTTAEGDFFIDIYAPW